MTSTGFNNSHLSTARRVKQDEFYTQWADIESEINAYREYDPDVFRDKVVLCPCDDPEWSNFAKYFALNFTTLGLKKLISTSYAPDSNPAGSFYAPTLFETEDEHFDPSRTRVNGKKFVLEREDHNGDGVINIDDLQWEYLEGDGDFRSAEVTALRDEADVIITNPPFSMFRAFIAWLIESNKKFSVIGSDAAVTTKDFFALVRSNTIWKGATGNTSDMVFGVPKGMAVDPKDAAKAKRLGYAPNDLHNFTRLGNSCWWTNLDHGRRHEPMQLMSMEDNIKFSKHKVVRGKGYRTMDNFDAIDVPRTDAIPSDYDGLMGVPISFLDRYNPDQFEIVSLTQTWSDISTKTYPGQTLVKPDGSRKKVGALNSGPAFKLDSPPDGEPYYEVDGEYYVSSFKRVLIKRKVAK
ncbi:adenine-specific methyltransferase EcoRI family protein [Nocardioides pinisoli]|uniref:Adenine-specific methyltransferase EcoRI family protein n=1 Tax=Nocardioides pinisoli TaxID=2950279 RepID=A0ABT1KYY3_9ACTN|nr:adenine-specific methyltransferase EcoRI family protein [Nocardioides pinisoli]MCP3422972.1 adenine-specific methyltransferase EcoRI family protein [Nocardioides pinisoli]